MAGVIIGLSDLHYAKLTTDPATGTATYATPVPMSGVISAKVNPNASSDTLFADDGPYETATSLGKISLELNVADLTFEDEAALLGHTVDPNGVLIRKSTDVPPWVAVGFKTLKSNGKYRYVWLAKGKFSPSQQEYQTNAEKVNFVTPTIAGSFVKRDCDDEWERHLDEDATGYTSTQGTNWFTNPYGTTA